MEERINPFVLCLVIFVLSIPVGAGLTFGWHLMMTLLGTP